MSSSVYKTSSNGQSANKNRTSLTDGSNLSLSVSNISSVGSSYAMDKQGQQRSVEALPNNLPELSKKLSVDALPDISNGKVKIKLAPMANAASLVMEKQSSVQLKKSASINSLKKLASTSSLKEMAESKLATSLSSSSLASARKQVVPAVKQLSSSNSASSLAASFSLDSLSSSNVSLPLDREAYTQQVLLRNSPLTMLNATAPVAAVVSGQQSDLSTASSTQSFNYVQQQRDLIKHTAATREKGTELEHTATTSIGKLPIPAISDGEASSSDQQRLRKTSSDDKLERNHSRSSDSSSMAGLERSLEASFQETAKEVRDLYAKKLEDLQKRELDAYIERAKELQLETKAKLDILASEEEAKLEEQRAKIRAEGDQKIKAQSGALTRELEEKVRLEKVERDKRAAALEKEFEQFTKEKETQLKVKQKELESKFERESVTLNDSFKRRITALEEKFKQQELDLEHKRSREMTELEQRWRERLAQVESEFKGQESTLKFEKDAKDSNLATVERLEAALLAKETELKEKVQFFESKLLESGQEFARRLNDRDASLINFNKQTSEKVIAELEERFEKERRGFEEVKAEYKVKLEEKEKLYSELVQSLELVKQHNAKLVEESQRAKEAVAESAPSLDSEQADANMVAAPEKTDAPVSTDHSLHKSADATNLDLDYTLPQISQKEEPGVEVKVAAAATAADEIAGLTGLAGLADLDLKAMEQALEQEKQKVREIHQKYRDKLHVLLDDKESLRNSPSPSRPALERLEEMVKAQKVIQIGTKATQNGVRPYTSPVREAFSSAAIDSDESEDADTERAANDALIEENYDELLKGGPSLISLKRHLRKEELNLKKSRNFLERQKKIVQMQHDAAEVAQREWKIQMKALSSKASEVAHISSATKYFDQVDEQVSANIQSLGKLASSPKQLRLNTALGGVSEVKSFSADGGSAKDDLRFGSLDEIDLEMSKLLRNLRSVTRNGEVAERYLQDSRARSPVRSAEEASFPYSRLKSLSISPKRPMTTSAVQENFEGYVNSAVNPTVNVSKGKDATDNEGPVFNSLMSKLYAPNDYHRRQQLERSQQRSATVLSNHREWLESFTRKKAMLYGTT